MLCKNMHMHIMHGQLSYLTSKPFEKQTTMIVDGPQAKMVVISEYNAP
jgi:hypothetical protein